MWQPRPQITTLNFSGTAPESMLDCMVLISKFYFCRVIATVDVTLLHIVHTVTVSVEPMLVEEGQSFEACFSIPESPVGDDLLVNIQSASPGMCVAACTARVRTLLPLRLKGHCSYYLVVRFKILSIISRSHYRATKSHYFTCP